MKRSQALAILSRDHHHALVVARKLRSAEGDARASFLEYWATQGRAHFRQEEELLLPAYAAYGDAHHPLVLRVLGDHVAIRTRVGLLGQTAPADPVLLRELGEALSAHVRLEERELFPLIEAAMPAEELLALAIALDSSEKLV